MNWSQVWSEGRRVLNIRLPFWFKSYVIGSLFPQEMFECLNVKSVVLCCGSLAVF